MTETADEDEDVILSEVEGSDLDGKIPWHFWILVVLVSLYLAYRLIQLGIMAFQSIF